MIEVIANDSINDFDDIGIDNYDYTTQEIFIRLDVITNES